jgi:hypothetical protein
VEPTEEFLDLETESGVDSDLELELDLVNLELELLESVDSHSEVVASARSLPVKPLAVVASAGRSQVEVEAVSNCGFPAPSSGRASLRGVTSGIRSSGPPPIIGACWVFLNDKLDALLGALQFQALDITHVFLQDALLLPTVRSLVPAITTIVTDPRDLPPLPCQLALVGFRVHPGFLDRLAIAGVVAALALCGTRHFRRPWHRTRLMIRHSS